MVIFTESQIILAVIGMLGLMSTFIVLVYGQKRRPLHEDYILTDEKYAELSAYVSTDAEVSQMNE